ncbi:MAG TPA: hypothetical protein VFC14_11255 [Burkholderiales bacterium]|jgi:hypothetical protein|nr:hypothetical protein [Burkholderiales bacterium]
MNKSHAATRSATRTRSSVAAARLRRTLLELDESDEFVDVPEAPRMAAILDDDDDWTETDTGVTDINLLLHGVSYR